MSLARLVLVLGACAACNSDDPFFESQSSSSGALPGTSTGGVPTTSGTSTGDSTTSTSSSSGDPSTTTTSDETTGAPPPDKTCREILMCVGECAIMFDLACFQMCAEGATPEAGGAALALGGCVLQSCFTSGKCSPETIMDIACLGCIGLGFLGGSPDGCEEEAEACM